MSAPQPTGRRNASLRKTVLDMVLSMAVVLGAVALVLVFVWRPQQEAVKPVDIGVTLATATRAAPFAPLVADPAIAVFAGWVPTSVRFEPTPKSDEQFVWHVGYVIDGGAEGTADDAYVQLVQSVAASDAFVAEQTADGVAGEPVRIDGVAWTRYETPGRRSLVRSAPANDGTAASAVTTVVSGTLGWPELEQVAAALTPGASGG